MHKIKFLLLFFIILISNDLISQKTIVKGTVIDAKTKETIPFALISFKGTKIGTTSDLDGNYILESYYSSDSLLISFLGYKNKTYYVKRDKSQIINVELETDDLELEAFEVVGSKKDVNPAHEFIRRVIANKKINNKVKLDAYQYEVYNKIEFDINNLDDKFMNRKMFKKFDFVFDLVDSTDEKPYLPVFIIESLSDYYFTRKPKKKKEIIKATKISGPENESISQYLGDMYQNTNIYDNSIYIFGKQFISPLNNNMLLHYQVFLTDSAFIDNNWCYKLVFKPKRKRELTFEGEMWIHDTTYAVKVFEAKLSGDANINFINSYKLKQTFSQVEKEVWMMVLDETVADINPLESDKQKGFYGRKTTSYKNFVINKPKSDEFFNTGNNIIVQDSARNKGYDYWDKNRHLALSEKENKIYHMIDTVKNLPIVKTYIDVIQTLASGYKIIGPIEIGPYSSIYSKNPIEGDRFALGLRTSNDFSKRIMLFGHVAYGVKDFRYKYEIGTKFFVTKKKTPRRLLGIKYINEVKQFDRDYFEGFSQNIISSFFRRNDFNKLLNIEGVKLDYFHEWFEGFSNTLELKAYNINSLGNVLTFKKSTDLVTTTVSGLQNTELTVGMRYAKDEKFVSGVFNRISLGSKAPILELKASFGLKNSFFSNFEYQKVKFNVSDRVLLGYWGTFKYEVEVGKLWGNVPFPFLFIHRGNETWGYYKKDYNALNVGEFISDEYASLSVAHYFGGVFLNRIPLLRRLKWRELVTGKIIYGRLDDRHKENMDFPAFSSSLSEQPYAEVSVGIENIFKVLRIDALWRVNYLDNSFEDINVLRFGIRGRLQFEF